MKKTSSFSRTGFIISLFMFLFAAIFHFMMYAEAFPLDLETFENVLFVIFTTGGALTLLGLILSIIGLIQGIRNQETIWMSVTGIILSFLIFGMIMFDFSLEKEPDEVIHPILLEKVKYPENECVIIYVNPEYIICENKISQSLEKKQIYFSDENFDDEFSGWIQELKNSECVKTDGSNLKINADRETGFTQINRIFELLRENEMNKFTLMTSLSDKSAD